MNNINSSLVKITKGSIIVFIGTAASLVLTFFTKIIIARNVGRDTYGMYVLLLAILEIITMTAILGLGSGGTRFIAYLREKKEIESVKRVIFICLKLTIGAGSVFAFLFFFLAPWISTALFHEPQLSSPLRVLSLGIPFLVAINILSSIFRGFGQVKPKVYFQDILRRVLIILFVAVVILFGYSLIYIIWGYLLASIVTVIVFAVYTYRKLRTLFYREKKAEEKKHPLLKRLLSFSLPLLATVILGTIMIRMDTLMIGYFKSSSEVGLYNGAVPLAKLLETILSSVGFIYLPIISSLWAKKMLPDIKRAYQVITKWVFSVIFPIFLLFLIFPKQCLNLFFGSNFVPASTVLQILSLGWFFHVCMGVNGLTLTGAGKTKAIMWGNMLAVGLNIILNILLIPKLGINGAALAFSTGIIITNVFISLKLYRLSKIHPFTKNYIKPIIISLMMVIVIYIFTKGVFTSESWWILPIFFFVFVFVYLASLILTRSLDKEDVMMAKIFEKRIGVRLTLIKKILRRFT
jgi:O-antigen/teichoic acid export membrane protein